MISIPNLGIEILPEHYEEVLESLIDHRWGPYELDTTEGTVTYRREYTWVARIPDFRARVEAMCASKGVEVVFWTPTNAAISRKDPKNPSRHRVDWSRDGF